MQRTPLSRERVLRAAVKVADEGGLQALTMRRLAEEVDAEAMSLYYHVAKKEDVLDGVADMIAAEINEAASQLAVPAGESWKLTARRRILAARAVMLRHPWAPTVLETRATVSPAVLRYYDGLLGLMLAGGLSYDLAHRALHALGSRALGFTQELFTPVGGADAAGAAGPGTAAEMAATFPHLADMLASIVHDNPDVTLGWCDDQAEFEFALDLILDGLDRLAA